MEPMRSRLRQGRLGQLLRDDPDDVASWIPRRSSPARTSVIVLQSIALGLVALTLAATAWWLVTSTAGARTETIVSAALVVPFAAAILAVGWTGLRRWLAGGPAIRLYGFDALPVIYLIASAGPPVLQDPLGIAITAAFVVPGMATYLATER